MSDLKLTLTGDESRAMAAVKRMEAAEKNVGNVARQVNAEQVKGAKQTEDQLKKTAKARQEGFGSRALSDLQRMATGYLTLGAAIGGIKTVINDVKKAMEESKAAVDANIAGFQRFTMLGSLSKKDREFLFEHHENLTPEEAHITSFAARSEKFTDAQIIELIKEAGYSKTAGEDPLQFATSIKGMKAGALHDKTIPQIASYLAKLAEASPLTASNFAGEFARDAAFGGASDRQKTAIAATISGIVSTLTLEENPEIATTALKGFLTKQEKGKGAQFMQKHGIWQKPLDTQIQTLSQMAQSNEWEKPYKTEKGQLTTLKGQFFEAFGDKTAPYLLPLLQSPERLKQLQTDIDVGTPILSSSGPSLFQQKVTQQKAQDPEFAAVAERRQMELERTQWQPLQRGFKKAHYAKQREEREAELTEAGEGSYYLGALRKTPQAFFRGRKTLQPDPNAIAEAAEAAHKVVIERQPDPSTDKNTQATEDLTNAVKILASAMMGITRTPKPKIPQNAIRPTRNGALE